MRVLVIDIGGNNVKVAVPGRHDVVKVPSGGGMSARKMVTAIRPLIAGWDFDVVSIGYPGVVVNGVPAEEPVNLGGGWVGFDFEGVFGRPVRFINDAAMQALGSYEGGRMLFLGLGTGLGTALVVDGMVLPLELAHLPYRKGRSYEDCIGKAGFDLFGRRRWREFVVEVVALLKHALQADYVVLGGGNIKELREMPPGSRPGANVNAMLGGVRLWEAPAWANQAVHPVPGSRRAASGTRGRTGTRRGSRRRLRGPSPGRLRRARPRRGVWSRLQGRRRRSRRAAGRAHAGRFRAGPGPDADRRSSRRTEGRQPW